MMGDGIMALFGAPLAHEDHAVRTSYAALRMQEAIRRYTDDVRRATAALPYVDRGRPSTTRAPSFQTSCTGATIRARALGIISPRSSGCSATPIARSSPSGRRRVPPSGSRTR
jgi:hypothetical protein